MSVNPAAIGWRDVAGAQGRLRARIVSLLAAGPVDAVDVRRVLVDEGWSRRQIVTARDAVVVSYREVASGRFVWRLRAGAQGRRGARRELLVCSTPGCGHHIGELAAAEGGVCFACRERAS